MSSRVLRRLQKEQLTLVEQNDSDEESDDYQPPSKAQNLFDLLNDDNDAGEEEEEEEQEAEKEKESIPSSLPVTSASATRTKAASSAPSSSKKNKKNKKKNKKQQNKATKQDVADLSLQQLDEMLDTLKMKEEATTLSCATGSADPESGLGHATRQLLSVNFRYLDPEAEMKRMFGARVVNREARPSGRLLKKTKLATPKADWPTFQKQGLTMETLQSEYGTTSFAFKHQEMYQDLQLDYLNAIAQHDPNGLVMLTHQHPYHVDSLIQLSEIAKQQGDWTVAGDCIDRALYASERAFHPHFTLGAGNVRLPYQRSENRSFFVSIVRNIQFLTRRGCWRTAFEFNKLLFSLSPFEDPVGALLSMDYYALSAREYQYVLEFGKTWQVDSQMYPKDLSFLPNFAFSMAYAKFKQQQQKMNDSSNSNRKKKDTDTDEDEEDTDDNDRNGSKTLRLAISRFPAFVPRLLQALDESDTTINGQMNFFNKTATDDYLTLLLALYVDYTHELWKEPEVLNWLKLNTYDVLNDQANHNKALSSVAQSDEHQQEAIPFNVCRHVLLLDRRELLSHLPRHVTNASYHSNDPLPPSDSITGYDIDERMRTSRSQRRGLNQQGGVIAMLQRLLGGRQVNAADRQIFQQAIEHLAQGGDGPMNGAFGAGDRIPGAFPGQGDYDDFDSDDDHESVTRSATVMDRDIDDAADVPHAPPPSHDDTANNEETWQRHLQNMVGGPFTPEQEQLFRQAIESLNTNDDQQRSHTGDDSDTTDITDLDYDEGGLSEEDLELQRALAESAQEYQQETSRRQQNDNEHQ